MTEKYDFLIIGAGGTGLAAAMYGARLGLKTLCLGTTHGTELPVGGVITTTDVVENYPGFIKLSGEEIAKKIEDHTRTYDKVTIKEEKVESISGSAPNFTVKTSAAVYESKTILFATGTKWRKLKVPGAEKFMNKGVAYCALCDAPLFKNKKVALVGGSDSAAKDALVLSEHAEKVYIIARSTLHPEPINMERIKQKKNIEVIEGTQVKEVKGSQFVESITLDKPYNKSDSLEVQGVFVAIGHIILSDLAKELGTKLNKKGEIMTDKESKTNLSGVYAAGDCADAPFKQLITGVAEGCVASHSAYTYINEESVKTK